MNRRSVVRAGMLATMAAVTAWSFWASAQRPAPSGMLMQVPGAMSAGSAFRAPRMPPHPAATAPGEGREPGNADEAAQEAAKEIEEENAPPAEINWTDFGRENPPYIALVINFALLMTGFYYFGKKPVAEALKTRRDTIAKDIEEAQRMRKEAEKRAKHYQAKLATLEEEVQTTREALVRAGEAERERIVAEAEAKAERMRKDAEFQVEQELKQLRQDLQRDTVEAAITAAEELLKKRVTQSDQERMAEDYLADLAKQGVAKSAGGVS